jgi:hypothetical protein
MIITILVVMKIRIDKIIIKILNKIMKKNNTMIIINININININIITNINHMNINQIKVI